MLSGMIKNVSLKKFCQADERKNYFSTTGFLIFFLPTELFKFAYICSQLFVIVIENVKNILPSRSGEIDIYTWKIRKNSELTRVCVYVQTQSFSCTLSGECS